MEEPMRTRLAQALVATTIAAVVKEKKVITTGSTGCASKTVKKTDEFGDSKTKTKVEC